MYHRLPAVQLAKPSVSATAKVPQTALKVAPVH